MTPNCEQRASLDRRAAVAVDDEQRLRGAARPKRWPSAIAQEAGDDPAAQVRRAWQLAFCACRPTSRDRAPALAFLGGTSVRCKRKLPTADQPKAPTTSRRQLALAHLCQALVSSNEFLYVD